LPGHFAGSDGNKVKVRSESQELSFGAVKTPHLPQRASRKRQVDWESPSRNDYRETDVPIRETSGNRGERKTTYYPSRSKEKVHGEKNLPD